MVEFHQSSQPVHSLSTTYRSDAYNQLPQILVQELCSILNKYTLNLVLLLLIVLLNQNHKQLLYFLKCRLKYFVVQYLYVLLIRQLSNLSPQELERIKFLLLEGQAIFFSQFDKDCKENNSQLHSGILFLLHRSENGPSFQVHFDFQVILKFKVIDFYNVYLAILSQSLFFLLLFQYAHNILSQMFLSPQHHQSNICLEKLMKFELSFCFGLHLARFSNTFQLASEDQLCKFSFDQMILLNFVWSRHLSISVQIVDVGSLDSRVRTFDRVQVHQTPYIQPQQFFYQIEQMRPFDQAYSKSLLIEEEIII